MKIVDEKLLKTFRGPGLCERCHCGQAQRDPHHCFIRKGMGGGSRLDLPENLIALCRACHDKAGASSIENAMCEQIIAVREFPPWGKLMVLPSDIHVWLQEVQFTRKEGPMPERPWVARPEMFHRKTG